MKKTLEALEIIMIIAEIVGAVCIGFSKIVNIRLENAEKESDAPGNSGNILEPVDSI